MLPAFMIWVLTEKYKTEFSNILIDVTPPKLQYDKSFFKNLDQHQVKFEKRVHKFNHQQQKAIFAFIECYIEIFNAELEVKIRLASDSESALVYWYLLSEDDLPKPNDING